MTMTRKTLISGLFVGTALAAAGCASSSGTPSASTPTPPAPPVPQASTEVRPAGTQIGRVGTLDPAFAPAAPILTSREAGLDPNRFFVRTGSSYRHKPSNITCGDTFPTALGDLTLERIIVESADGATMSCNYVLGGYGTYITQHVRHDPATSLRDMVRKSMTNLSAAHANHAAVKVISPLEVKPGRGGTDVGSFGLLVTYAGKPPFRISSMTSKVGDWSLSIVGTYPDSDKSARFEQDLRASFAAHTSEIGGQ